MRSQSRFKFAQEVINQSILVIGCGHSNSLLGRNCKSDHIGATTIDIEPKIAPDFIIDMNNPDPRTDLEVKYKKILFEGCSPSFWKENVVKFLLNNLAEDGEVYLTGNSHSAEIIVEESKKISENIDSSVSKFVHEYAKIFDYNSLQNRIQKINSWHSKDYDQLEIDSSYLYTLKKESIERADLKLFSYLVEQKYAKITREDGYEIAKMGNLEFLQYILENTTLMAVYCSPNDETENYMDFLCQVFSSSNTEEFKRKAIEIPALKDLCVKHNFLQLEFYFPEYCRETLSAVQEDCYVKNQEFYEKDAELVGSVWYFE